MIRIEKIEIEEFRGIRKLELKLGKKNFGICGPNGTGKSGVVDAVEFALTGNVTRLSGSGTADLSVKAHAPHVDSQKTPEKSRVKITAYSPIHKKQFTVERRVSTATTVDVQPNNAATKAIVDELALHPEFALSRREIVKYIITPPGQRSKDVQTLLRLDQIEKVRQSLQKIANEIRKDAQQAEIAVNNAKSALLTHLGLSAFSDAAILEVINQRRKLLVLEEIKKLEGKVSLKSGVVAEKPEGAVTRIAKVSAQSEIGSFKEEVAKAGDIEHSQARTNALTILKELQSNPERLRSFQRQTLFQQGLDLLEEDACPLCDTAWDLGSLKEHLTKKLALAEEAAATLESLQDAIQPIVNNYKGMSAAAAKLVTTCSLAEPKLDATPISEFAEACDQDCEAIEQVAENPLLIGAAITALSGTLWSPTPQVVKASDDLEQHVKALPDASNEELAREFLIMAQERYESLQFSEGDRAIKTIESAVAARVLEIYGTTSTAVLEGIYDAVESDFTDYYRIINRDDEEKFEGKLSPSPAKLALDVDFYGRGKFPPGAYHSEGHQDGMGLCLYLALMKHTLGKDFTFAVLDDVLMSVDSGHRREVCTLLNSKFPDTQFVLTTHDPVWLQFMRTENVIQSCMNFAGWSVETGPQVWEEGDVWDQIAEKLTKNDVSGAAATLRRYLEYISTVLADNLRASIEYHANGFYDLGDLMPPVVRAWKLHLGLAGDSASSWGQDTKPIEAIQTDANAKASASNAEQWMINKAVHYNIWATLQKEEFELVVAAFKGLLESMRCQVSQCRDFFYVSPRKGFDKEALRCGCGALNLNLKKKKQK